MALRGIKRVGVDRYADLADGGVNLGAFDLIDLKR